MRKRMVYGLLLTVCFSAALAADDKAKPDEVIPLQRADLEKLEGVWELKVDTKAGWKGTIRASIALNPADAKQADLGRIRYEANLDRGVEQTRIKNAPIGGVLFAGIKRGDKLSLVTSKEGHLAPFKLNPIEELSAPFTLTDDKLTLDVSKSSARFCSPFSDVDLNWDKLVLTKIKKEPPN